MTAQNILTDYIRETLKEYEFSTRIHLPERTKGSYQYPNLGIDIQRGHNNTSWNGTNEILPKEDSFMLPLNIWVDFANLIRSDNEIYNCAGKRIPIEVIRALRND